MNEESRRFWNEWDSTYREGRTLDTLDAEAAARGRIVLDWAGRLGLPRTARILEVGCANGWLSEHLSRLGRVTGTDLADEVIARAQARLPDIRFVAGDFLMLDLPSGGFDVVVSLETLFCMPDQPGFVARAASLLAPGGHLLLTTHNRFTYERCEDVAPIAPGQIRRWLTTRELDQLLAPHFVTVRRTTVNPAGHLGILRLVNSYKINGLLERVVGAELVTRLKERAGLGLSHVVLARKRSPAPA